MFNYCIFIKEKSVIKLLQAFCQLLVSTYVPIKVLTSSIQCLMCPQSHNHRIAIFISQVQVPADDITVGDITTLESDVTNNLNVIKQTAVKDCSSSLQKLEKYHQICLLKENSQNI